MTNNDWHARGQRLFEDGTYASMSDDGATYDIPLSDEPPPDDRPPDDGKPSTPRLAEHLLDRSALRDLPDPRR